MGCKPNLFGHLKYHTRERRGKQKKCPSFAVRNTKQISIDASPLTEKKTAYEKSNVLI